MESILFQNKRHIILKKVNKDITTAEGRATADAGEKSVASVALKNSSSELVEISIKLSKQYGS